MKKFIFINIVSISAIFISNFWNLNNHKDEALNSSTTINTFNNKKKSVISNKNIVNNNYKSVSDGNEIKTATRIESNYNQKDQQKTKVIINAGDGSNMLDYNFNVKYSAYNKSGIINTNNIYNANGYTKMGYDLGSENNNIESSRGKYLSKYNLLSTITVEMPYFAQGEEHLRLNSKSEDYVRLLNQSKNIDLYYSIDATGILTDPSIAFTAHFKYMGKWNNLNVGSFGVYNFYSSGDYLKLIYSAAIGAAIFCSITGFVTGGYYGLKYLVNKYFSFTKDASVLRDEFEGVEIGSSNFSRLNTDSEQGIFNNIVSSEANTFNNNYENTLSHYTNTEQGVEALSNSVVPSAPQYHPSLLSNISEIQESIYRLRSVVNPTIYRYRFYNIFYT